MKPALAEHHFTSKPNIVAFSSLPERKLSGVIPILYRTKALCQAHQVDYRL